MELTDLLGNRHPIERFENGPRLAEINNYSTNPDGTLIGKYCVSDKRVYDNMPEKLGVWLMKNKATNFLFNLVYTGSNCNEIIVPFTRLGGFNFLKLYINSSRKFELLSDMCQDNLDKVRTGNKVIESYYSEYMGNIPGYDMLFTDLYSNYHFYYGIMQSIGINTLDDYRDKVRKYDIYIQKRVMEIGNFWRDFDYVENIPTSLMNEFFDLWEKTGNVEEANGKIMGLAQRYGIVQNGCTLKTVIKLIEDKIDG